MSFSFQAGGHPSEPCAAPNSNSDSVSYANSDALSLSQAHPQPEEVTASLLAAAQHPQHPQHQDQHQEQHEDDEHELHEHEQQIEYEQDPNDDQLSEARHHDQHELQEYHHAHHDHHDHEHDQYHNDSNHLQDQHHLHLQQEIISLNHQSLGSTGQTEAGILQTYQHQNQDQDHQEGESQADGEEGEEGYYPKPSLKKRGQTNLSKQELDPKLKEPTINLDYRLNAVQKIQHYRSSPETYPLCEKFIGMDPENFDKLIRIIQTHHSFSSSRQSVEKQVSMYLYSRTWNASFKQISKCCGCSMATVAIYKERVHEAMTHRVNTIVREVRSKLWDYLDVPDEEQELSEGEEAIRVSLTLSSDVEHIISQGPAIMDAEAEAAARREQGNPDELDTIIDEDGNPVDSSAYRHYLEGTLEEETVALELMAKIKARNPTLDFDQLEAEWRRIRKIQRARDRNETYLSETARLKREANESRKPKKERKPRKDKGAKKPNNDGHEVEGQLGEDWRDHRVREGEGFSIPPPPPPPLATTRATPNQGQGNRRNVNRRKSAATYNIQPNSGGASTSRSNKRRGSEHSDSESENVSLSSFHGRDQLTSIDPPRRSTRKNRNQTNLNERDGEDEDDEIHPLTPEEEEIERKKIHNEIFGEETGDGSGIGEDGDLIDILNGNSVFKAQSLLMQSIEEERQMKVQLKKDYEIELKRIKIEYEERRKEELKFVRNRIKVVKKFVANQEVGNGNEKEKGNEIVVDQIQNQDQDQGQGQGGRQGEGEGALNEEEVENQLDVVERSGNGIGSSKRKATSELDQVNQDEVIRNLIQNHNSLAGLEEIGRAEGEGTSAGNGYKRLKPNREEGTSEDQLQSQQELDAHAILASRQP